MYTEGEREIFLQRSWQGFYVAALGKGYCLMMFWAIWFCRGDGVNTCAQDDVIAAVNTG